MSESLANLHAPKMAMIFLGMGSGRDCEGVRDSNDVSILGRARSSFKIQALRKEGMKRKEAGNVDVDWEEVVVRSASCLGK